MNFVKSALKYKQLTISFLVLFFALGVYSLLTMPRREDPKITIPQGLIITYLPGANSQEVENQITKKLERYLFQFEEVKKEKTHSVSSDGMSVITVEINQNVKNPDVFWSKLRHQLMGIKVSDLPKGVVGPMVNSDFGDTEAMVIALESNEASYTQLNNQVTRIEDAVKQIKQASKIKIIGALQEQISVEFDSDKLAFYELSLPDVIKIIESQNGIFPSGKVKGNNIELPLHTGGAYQNEFDLKNQVINISKTGEVLRLGDVASIVRKDSEEKSKLFINGQKAVIITVQMHNGNNIVSFGKEVSSKLDELAATLPSNMKMTTIVNQPELVDHNISHFIREFFLAIIAVVVVVVLMLPLQIAAVAAMAIPMSVAVTFALMSLFGIELHQVSLAALIVVLGMVVDDAIVVADNYVELLDKGVKRWEAAWRSASDLVVPIFTATITIIASFLPMVFLKGTIGEFIQALPLTVTIALATSFIVAMVFTPMLCFAFIKKGLHDHSEGDKKKKSTLLDKMQVGYNQLLDWCIKHRKTTIAVSFLGIILAALIYLFGVKQRFFPFAERNQFVIELWMPTGTKLERTEASLRKIEKHILKEKRVVDVASFIGTGSPRFYYNYSPELPASNYGQILIKTTDDKAAEEYAEELSKVIESWVPEGEVQVKMMQQGQPQKAPVEVRIMGDDLEKLAQIRDTVKQIVMDAKGSRYVRDDFRGEYQSFKIIPSEEATKLGFTSEMLAKTAYTAFAGAPISKIYEGDKEIQVNFRLDEKGNRSFQDLMNLYVKSPLTGSSVPLRQIATIELEWNYNKIAHRNGIRTLTVQSETAGGALPSQIVKEIQPKLKALELPVGYKIEFGGEHGNKGETLSQMIGVLGISLLAIFFIILIQFKNLKEAAIIMLTIPLSLFGALLGLLVTGNNFGFTAFVGLIALSGIVVRNAIILVDHAHELKREGMDTHTAIVESGKRRLRPIFLTAMAAAIGVLPMILSGSPMWSPLASVIAMGVTWSMFMALLTVPALYVAWVDKNDKPDEEI